MRGCEIDVAVFTNLSPEHLDFHGTLQGYLDAKAILFELLAKSADKGVPKTAVLNADDPHWQYLADRAAPARVITYGIDAHADVQGSVISAEASGSRVTIASHDGQEPGSSGVQRRTRHTAAAWRRDPAATAKVASSARARSADAGAR
jgi:UDP-N-acetylmuramoyl-L-alanyl-D-glutamate--2,6-diaminopimelate ligase